MKRIILWLGRVSGIAPNDKPANRVTISQISALDEGYLFDFKNYASQYNNSVSSYNVIATNTNGGSFITTAPTDNPNDDLHGVGGSFLIADDNTGFVRLKPVDVLHELEMPPTPFLLIMLDEKISVLKDKASLIRQDYSKREVEALIERLENRKRYSEFRPFFESFQSTTEEKISELLKNHTHLCMKTSDIFIPEFPDIAIKRMKEYEDNMQKLCGKKPVFYVIAEHDKFREAFKQRDPILLAQSPFGFFYSILGAWDKEMMLLSEL